MQASTYICKQELETLMENLGSRTAQTLAGLIKSAAKVFATSGLTGTTTREIACVAAVNQVKLFRHFQNKEQLLAAVITEAIAFQKQALAHYDQWSQNLYLNLFPRAKSLVLY